MNKEEINNLFEYDNGILIWKKKIAPKSVPGKRAGTLNKISNRRSIWIYKKNYYESHLIWIMFNGSYTGVVDHINRDSTDNKIENLRVVTQRENTLNRSTTLIKKSKLPSCIFYDPTNKKNHYYIRCVIDGKKKIVGWAVTADEAYNKYKKMFNINI